MEKRDRSSNYPRHAKPSKYLDLLNHLNSNLIVNYLMYALLGLATILVALFLTSQNLIDSKVNVHTISLLTQIGGLISILILGLYLSKEINLAFYVKLGLSYIVYWLVSYSLMFTQNINNETFYLLDLKKNNFFELNSWWVVVLVICISNLAHFLFTKKEVGKLIHHFIERLYKPNLGLSLLTSLIVIQDTKIIETLKSFLYLENTSDLSRFFFQLFYKVVLIVVFVSLISYMTWKAVDGIKSNKSTLSLTIVTSVGLATMFNFLIQYFIKSDTAYSGYFVFPGATLFQIIVFTLLNLCVYLIFNRYWLSTLWIIFSGTAFTIANETKFLMRSEPILWTDMSMVSQLNVILSFVDKSLIIYAILLLLFFLGLYFFLKKRYLKGKIFNILWKRIVIAGLVVSTFGGIYQFFASQKNYENVPVLSRLNNLMNIDFEGHATKARYKSLSFVWIQQMAKPVMETPENYSEEAINEIVEKYSKRAEEINKTRTNDIYDQTLIFILSESLSDPNRVDGVKLTENVLPNILSIKDKTTSGLMKADNYGGGTANMETQTLVGLPLYNLSAYIYNVEIIPKMNYLPSITDGYEADNKYFIHLGGIQLYSRADIYNRLDFGTMIADDDGATAPTVNEKYGGYPSDKSTYQNILDNIDANESQFFSVVTYQNHVPWSMPEPTSISGTGEGFTSKENERLSHYARLLKKTDTDTKELLNQLSKVDKEITVVFYGDHLPGLYPESAFQNNPDSKYLTDYFIWSNKGKEKKDYPVVSSSDFPAAVLSHTNSKVSPFYALLTDVLEQASVGVKEKTPEQEKIAEELRLIEYDLISGKGYLTNYLDFFKF